MAAESPKYNAGELQELVSPTDLLRSLECPICTEVCQAPIFLCTNGHNICSNCKPKLTQCGLCNGRLTNTRNYAIESIVAASKFKCRYGCEELVKGDQQEKHGKSCQLRPIPCNEHSASTKCNGRLIPFQDYFTHLKDAHKISGEGVRDGNSNQFPITSSAPDLLSDRRFPSFYMLWDGHAFISNVSVTDGRIFWWVTIIDQEDEASKYVGKLLLYEPNNSKMQIEWTFPIHSVRKSVDEIHKNALCAILPVLCMQPFMKQSNNSSTGPPKQCWSTKYTIEKVPLFK
jgi:hypothetical protein